MRKVLHDLKIAGLVVIIIFVMTIIVNFILGIKINWSLIKNQVFYNIYYGVPLTLANGWFFDYMGKKIPWEKSPRRRVVLGILGSISITLLTVFIANIILWVLIKGYDYEILFSSATRTFYITAVGLTILITTTIHAIGFFQEVQKEKKLNAKLRKEKLEMELNALRAHIDPHFLFNSFNVLSGLIDENRDKAQAFLAGLSKIYRYILEQRNEETSTLEDEMVFAKRYLELLRMRFEDSIIFETQIEDTALLKKIPSLTLQLLLENAIKHNAFGKEAPLHILIAANNSSMSVSNNKSLRSQLSGGNKMGLQNIRDRYALLSDRPIEVIDQEDTFTVKLPLL